MIQTDMDRWTSALSKCKLDKAILPISRGYLIENVDSYNKIQTILNTPAMEHCHKFLYNLDVEDLQEDEVKKIDELYQLGQERGFISPDDCDVVDDTCDQQQDDQACTSTDLTSAPPQPQELPIAQPVCTAPIAAYTVMYSAMKDGQIKTGEAYSNSISPRAAKADVLAKLSQIGYDNISILAIEVTDPDGSVVTQTSQTQPSIGQVGTAIADDDAGEVNEASKDKAADVDADTDAEDDAEDDVEAADDKDKEANNKELSASEKAKFKDEYKLVFKETMFACKFDGMAFDNLTLEQKVEFITKLNEKWDNKPDPIEFMTQDDVDALNSTVMKG